MRIAAAPHRWTLSPRQAMAVQRRLASQVIGKGPGRPIRFIAGVDAAFSADGRLCIAGAVLWDAQAQRAIEEVVATRPLRFPYVPGLLSFREAPAVLAALRKLKGTPDAIMCDGQGLAHPRRFGIACHIGIITGLPTLGCAKSRLIGTHVEPGIARGSTAPLRDRGEVIGSVLRTQQGVRTVYVSVGHRFGLRAAAALALACSARYRIPEPTRLADQLVARIKRAPPR